MSRAPFPWKQAIGFGLGVLHLSPDAFWRMTPRELAAAMETVLGPRDAAIDAVSFAALRVRSPDTPAN